MILPLRGDYEVQHETGGKYTGSSKAPVNRDDVHPKSIRLVARNAENAICCKLCVWNNLRSFLPSSRGGCCQLGNYFVLMP